jgi:hypothetical protein
MDGDSTAALRRAISAAWRPGSRRGGRGSERRVRGTYRRGLDGHYSRVINGAVTPVTVSRNGERGRGISGRREMTDGSHQSARGREELGTASGLS